MTDPATWPGRDGWFLIGLAVLTVAYYAVRDLGGEHLVAAVLIVDALYLSVTWWSRR